MKGCLLYDKYYRKLERALSYAKVLISFLCNVAYKIAYLTAFSA